jgi:hypothetical protein
MQAFQQLAAKRWVTSAGVQAIPFTEIVAWLNFNNVVDQYERDEYMQILSAMDLAFLSAKRSGKKRKTTSSQTPAPRKRGQPTM